MIDTWCKVYSNSRGNEALYIQLIPKSPYRGEKKYTWNYIFFLTARGHGKRISRHARASFPRIRFDQLMSFCWTVLLPVVIAFIVLIPCILYSFDIIPSNISLLTLPLIMKKDFMKRFYSSGGSPITFSSNLHFSSPSYVLGLVIKWAKKKYLH